MTVSRRRRRFPRFVAAGLLLAAVAGSPRAPAGAQPGAPADQWVVSDGVWLRYRVVGSAGPVLLVLHGSTDQADPLLPLARTLGVGRRVVLLDPRGFGMSGKPVDVAQYGAAFVDDVVQLLDGLRADRVDLLGHGTGALVAAKVVARHPARVRRAVLVGGPLYRDRGQLARTIAPTIAALERGVGAAATRARATDAAGARAFDRRALLAAMRSFPSLHVDPAEVRGARVPVLAVAGARDAFADAARGLPAWWPGASATVVDGATHDGVLADPRFAARVREFLAGR